MLRKLLVLCLTLVLFACSAPKEETSEKTDVEYIKEKGTLIVGITDFAPMDYKDSNGEWIGFDADLARIAAEELGVKVEFIEIEWDSKILELDNKSIDVVWNGMTLTDEVMNAMSCSKPYLNNAPVVIVNKNVSDQYQTVDSLKGLNFAVEAGSSGQGAAETNGLSFRPVSSQADTLLEVAAGTSDAAIIDSLMAAAMVGEGTSYPDLTYTVSFEGEQYGVGCRKGSDLADVLNSLFDKLSASGELEKIAVKYDVQGALVK